MEAVLLLVEAALVAGPGLWMAVAVADNWRHPRMNEEAMATVMRLELMAREYPEDYAQIAHRRIDDRRKIRLLFLAIRAVETVAAVALLVSALLLVLAAAGAVPGAIATGAAIVSAAAFTMTWAGLVTGGNYFAYWYCHPWAQTNHFMLMFWGFFVLLVLMI